VDGNANEFFVTKTNSSTSGKTTGFNGAQRPSRTHVVTVVEPTNSAPGVITITMDRGTDPDHNQATENWKLTLYDNAKEPNSFVDISPTVFVIKNPSSSTVARWLAEENTAIDVQGVFDNVLGNQSVVIKAQ